MDKSTISVVGSIGAWLAAFVSYSVNHSILWAIFHFLCGWSYIIYRLVFHTGLLDFLK